MPTFSELSLRRLNTCDRRLKLIFLEVIKHVDCSVIEGERELERQRVLLAKGVTKTLISKHLKRPSKAIDVVPYPLNFELVKKNDPHELRKYFFLAGFVFAIAAKLSIKLRWGGAWKQRYVLNNYQDFDDLAHYELLTGEETYRL